MTTGCEFMLSFGSSQPTSDNPSSPGSLCLRTPCRPWPAKGPEAPSSHIPLEPTPPFLSGEGVLGPLPRTKRGLPRPLYHTQEPRLPGWASNPFLSTFSSGSYDPPGLLPWASPTLSHPHHQPQAPAASVLPLPGSQGLIGAQAGVVDVHRVRPHEWVSTAYHVPGLGASSPPSPCPPGHWGERSAASPPRRLGEGCGLPQGAHCGLETPSSWTQP